MFLRVAHFAYRNRRHLKAGEGVNQKQYRLRECAGCGPGSKRECLWIEKKQTDADEDYYRDQFADSENIADDRRLPDAQHVDRRQHTDDDDDDGSTPDRVRGGW